MERQGRIVAINGPVVRARGLAGFAMREMVEVGPLRLLGEVIRQEGDEAILQVFEDTQGLLPGEPVVGLGEPLSVTLGPGLVGAILDGIGRPLGALMKKSGPFLGRGGGLEQLDEDRNWEIFPQVTKGDIVTAGTLLATVKETPLVEHRLLLPPDMEGEVLEVLPQGFHDGRASLLRLRDGFGRERVLPLMQRWPVRRARPVRQRLLPEEPLLTGQRVIDGYFPIARGGVAAIPGGFGTGKTVTQHQLAKWSDAQLVVYIGCGERGNEMTQVLEEFPSLEDPKTGRPLMERTILIANTSNMPVAAREASIYTGLTIAEYFRDMGYDVALMADSTSRWAEALREISGRLEEIPAEEGFPAYLPSRLAEFYERAGRVTTMGGERGSVTLIGAVSPPGGDFTEPVTRHTKRFIRCFWALERDLASARHYPAISWMNSYSEYAAEVRPWFESHIDPRWGSVQDEVRRLLSEDERVQQVIQLVGEDVLPDEQRLVALVASIIKIGFLQQGAFGPDAFCPPAKTFAIMELIVHFYRRARDLVAKDVPLRLIREAKEVEALYRLREISVADLASFEEIRLKLESRLERIGTERLAVGRDRR
ncbi:V-type ATP synthase subunit A [Aminithiophilus ramosus]|uniref:V-type ATP synthase alpha chain n=2 Tax=Synergistales TaxID=649776 RepID=A0A9Q7EUI4_9BACT|nr:V-type ATP synthase subunit A [Aminithiophilus ramosus]QTX31718.1 V-type ATP synthase subunit A [Aminithiophilus ramosus]QVL35541.1 V-type ATP synthase subunit A [Synergistota bacterium]